MKLPLIAPNLPPTLLYQLLVWHNKKADAARPTAHAAGDDRDFLRHAAIAQRLRAQLPP